MIMISSNKTDGSKIKGGGRAILSEESQQALIDLLMCEDHKNEDIDLANISKHDKKRLEKKFIKKLIHRHEKEMHKRRFNSANCTAAEADGGSFSNDCPTNNMRSKQTSSMNDKCIPNVRIELVEAIFPSTNDDDDKKKKEKISDDDGKKKKKKKPDNAFKVGTKKVLVFPRATTIPELLKQSQSKLKMKKKPVRVFVETSTSNLFELDQNLAAIDDGTILYVSSTPAKKKKEQAEETASDDDDEEKLSKEEAFDPLESVKRAYKQQKLYQQIKQQQRVDEIIDEIRQQKHAQTRSTLPVASCKQHILDVVGKNQVVVLSGSTGSGKSTQVPQFLLHHKKNWQQRPYIVVTQPRKVAAISLANRVAEERGSPSPGSKGSSVGYMVRLDRKVDLRSCRIIYMTIGILLRMLIQPVIEIDQTLNDENTAPPLSMDTISHLIIDEVHGEYTSSTHHNCCLRLFAFFYRYILFGCTDDFPVLWITPGFKLERDVNTDFALTLLKGMLSSKSSHQGMPRLILMSATASTELFVKYFNNAKNGPPVSIEVPGKIFPVKTCWLSDCEKYCGKTMLLSPKTPAEIVGNDGNSVKLSPRALDNIDYKFVRSLIVKIVEEQQSDGSIQITPNGKFRATGAILVFLPGLSEIQKLAHTLNENDNLGDKKFCHVLKLHSTTPKYEQDLVFQPVLKGVMKIVLATNIAETSLTIPDVSHVIDSCRVKESRYNSSARIKELITVWTSQASLNQRAGRAGRTSEGFCWRLCSEEFAEQCLLPQTAPELVRTPLDELILQICLLYEQRRDDFNKSNAMVNDDSESRFATGVKPIKFLSMTPTPPQNVSIVQAWTHLLEVGAIEVVDSGESVDEEMNCSFRLTPLGYHLSRLPMDAKVGKILVVGCILGCLDGALTIAASLSCSRSCFRSSNGLRPVDQTYVHARDLLIENGFGGRDWAGGTAKGDLIAVIAVYCAWKKQLSNEKWVFSTNHALDNIALQEIDRLRKQFMELIIDAGLVSRPALTGKSCDLELDDCNLASEDALITSSCLVAGLYPNICTLVRPRKGGPKGGMLLTNDGDACRPSSSSFQRKRVKEASEGGKFNDFLQQKIFLLVSQLDIKASNHYFFFFVESKGKDAYAVYHTKHRTLGTDSPGGLRRRAPETFLSEVNFVSKFALLLFGGNLELLKNSIIVDGWLKFKVSGDGEKNKGKGIDNTVLIIYLRKLMDDVMNEHVLGTCSSPTLKANMTRRHQRIIEVVRKILADAG